MTRPLSSSRRLALRGALALGAASLLPGCAGYYYGDKYGPTLNGLLRTNLVDTSHRAADALMQGVALEPTQPIIVATLVHVDRLQESSRLGRMVSEQIAGRLVQRGVRVTELKLREHVAMQREGEMLLSRELRDVSRAHDAQAVVTGTYAVTVSQVYISLKLIHPLGNRMLAAHDYAVPVDEDVRILLTAR